MRLKSLYLSVSCAVIATLLGCGGKGTLTHHSGGALSSILAGIAQNPAEQLSTAQAGVLAVGEQMRQDLFADLISAGLTAEQSTAVGDFAKADVASQAGQLAVESGLRLADFDPVDYAVGPFERGAISALDEAGVNLGDATERARIAGVISRSGFEALSTIASGQGDAALISLQGKMIDAAVSNLANAGLEGEGTAGALTAITQGASDALLRSGVSNDGVQASAANLAGKAAAGLQSQNLSSDQMSAALSAVANGTITGLGSAGVDAGKIADSAGGIAQATVASLSVNKVDAAAYGQLAGAVASGAITGLGKAKVPAATIISSNCIANVVEQAVLGVGKVSADETKTSALMGDVAGGAMKALGTVDLGTGDLRQQAVGNVIDGSIRSLAGAGVSGAAAIAQATAGVARESVAALPSAGISNLDLAQTIGRVSSQSVDSISKISGVSAEDALTYVNKITEGASSGVGRLLSTNKINAAETATASAAVSNGAVSSLAALKTANIVTSDAQAVTFANTVAQGTLNGLAVSNVSSAIVQQAGTAVVQVFNDPATVAKITTSDAAKAQVAANATSASTSAQATATAVQSNSVVLCATEYRETLTNAEFFAKVGTPTAPIFCQRAATVCPAARNTAERIATWVSTGDKLCSLVLSLPNRVTTTTTTTMPPPPPPGACSTLPLAPGSGGLLYSLLLHPSELLSTQGSCSVPLSDECPRFGDEMPYSRWPASAGFPPVDGIVFSFSKVDGQRRSCVYEFGILPCNVVPGTPNFDAGSPFADAGVSGAKLCYVAAINGCPAPGSTHLAANTSLIAPPGRKICRYDPVLPDCSPQVAGYWDVSDFQTAKMRRFAHPTAYRCKGLGADYIQNASLTAARLNSAKEYLANGDAVISFSPPVVPCADVAVAQAQALTAEDLRRLHAKLTKSSWRGHEVDESPHLSGCSVPSAGTCPTFAASNMTSVSEVDSFGNKFCYFVSDARDCPATAVSNLNFTGTHLTLMDYDRSIGPGGGYACNVASGVSACPPMASEFDEQGAWSAGLTSTSVSLPGQAGLRCTIERDVTLCKDLGYSKAVPSSFRLLTHLGSDVHACDVTTDSCPEKPAGYRLFMTPMASTNIQRCLYVEDVDACTTYDQDSGGSLSSADIARIPPPSVIGDYAPETHRQCAGHCMHPEAAEIRDFPSYVAKTNNIVNVCEMSIAAPACVSFAGGSTANASMAFLTAVTSVGAILPPNFDVTYCLATSASACPAVPGANHSFKGDVETLFGSLVSCRYGVEASCPNSFLTLSDIPGLAAVPSLARLSNSYVCSAGLADNCPQTSAVISSGFGPLNDTYLLAGEKRCNYKGPVSCVDIAFSLPLADVMSMSDTLTNFGNDTYFCDAIGATASCPALTTDLSVEGYSQQTIQMAPNFKRCAVVPAPILCPGTIDSSNLALLASPFGFRCFSPTGASPNVTHPNHGPVRYGSPFPDGGQIYEIVLQ